MRYSAIFFTFISLLFFAGSGSSQQIGWKLEYLGFFHNQEFFNRYIEPQTMAGSRLSGQVILKPFLNQELGIGLDYIYEFGAGPFERQISPILYGHHQNEFVNLYFGAFPRRRIFQLPDILYRDTIYYYRPNIEGVYVEFNTNWASQKFWVDWTGRQSETRRESFALGLTGQFKKSIFFLRYDYIMSHKAGALIPNSNDHIRDNGGFVAGTGLDASSMTIFDTLSLYAAYCFSYDQLRQVYNVNFYNGLLCVLNISYKGFGIHDSFYNGEGQVQVLGDSFYTSRFYNRTDIYWEFLRKDFIYARFEFGFHVVPYVLDFHQKIFMRIDLAGFKNLVTNHND